jgi:hypothetical protein
MLDLLFYALRGLGIAMLPAPERDDLARRYYLDAARWSFVIGLMQLFAGTTAFMVLGIAFMRGGFSIGAGLLLENWTPGLTTTHMRGMGLINWLAWLLNPVSWVLGYVAGVGLLRVAAFVITREAVGEPLILGCMRLVQVTHAWRIRKRFETSLGPPRPDRWVRAAEKELVLLTCREKPDWTDTVTIEHEERYYKCVGVETRRDGEWSVMAYRLREEPPGAIIRRLVIYSSPS